MRVNLLTRAFTIKQQFTDYTLLEVKPYTDARRQNSRACKHAGHSLVCDENTATQKPKPPLQKHRGLKRLCLHAGIARVYATGSAKVAYQQQNYQRDIAVPLQKTGDKN